MRRLACKSSGGCVFSVPLDGVQLASSDLCRVYSRRDGDFCKSLVSPLIGTTGEADLLLCLRAARSYLSCAGSRVEATGHRDISHCKHPLTSRPKTQARSWLEGPFLAGCNVCPKHVCKSEPLTWLPGRARGTRAAGTPRRACGPCLPRKRERVPTGPPAQACPPLGAQIFPSPGS